ncbi:MAG: hypothetical protein M3R49_09830 [Chloroflexota bacterium]|nr:hypothetical protein [Chloroflexota bacterium]MDQ2935254.1 hypothetical protein [Chloroflexota bacterium]
MTITPITLFRAAAAAAATAGLIFIGVQFNHPHLDATSITTTDVVVRNSLKMLMAALALAGITGIYLRQVTKIGSLGLLGYVLFAAGYLSMLGTEFVAALVLPSIAQTSPDFVNDVIAMATNQPVTGDIGLMRIAILFNGITYVGGGVIFAIALFRANVLARWAAAVLTVGTFATIAAGLVPQYERLFALPTGLALVGLGYSLWRELGTTPAARPVVTPSASVLDAVAAR